MGIQTTHTCRFHDYFFALTVVRCRPPRCARSSLVRFQKLRRWLHTVHDTVRLFTTNAPPHQLHKIWESGMTIVPVNGRFKYVEALQRILTYGGDSAFVPSSSRSGMWSRLMITWNIHGLIRASWLCVRWRNCVHVDDVVIVCVDVGSAHTRLL
jgi:hypothetical protein